MKKKQSIKNNVMDLQGHSEDEYRRKLKSIITKKDYTSPNFWKKSLKERLFKSVALIVRMELNNGNYRTFLQVIERDQSFKYNKRRYVFDSEKRYFDLDLQMYCINYHEALSVPIRQHIPVTKIKDTMKDMESEIYNALDPLTLENLMESKIAEGMMKGQAIDDYLRKYGTLILFILVAVVTHLLLFMWKSGMFDQIGGTLGLG